MQQNGALRGIIRAALRGRSHHEESPYTAVAAERVVLWTSQRVLNDIMAGVSGEVAMLTLSQLTPVERDAAAHMAYNFMLGKQTPFDLLSMPHREYTLRELKAIRSALAESLDELEQQALDLWDDEKLDYRQIARKLNLSETRVVEILARGISVAREAQRSIGMA